MSRQKIGSENIRKIVRIGNTSSYITIPIEYMRELKWREGQKVVVKKRGKKLIVEDWEK